MNNISRLFQLLVVFGLFLMTANGQSTATRGTIKPLEAVYDQSTDESIVRLSSWIKVANVPGLVYDGNSDPHGGRPLINPTIEKPEVVGMMVRLKYRGKVAQLPSSVNIRIDSTSSRGFLFKKDRKVLVNTDSNSFDFGDARLIKSEKETDSRGMSAPYFIEELEVNVPLEKYREILKSRKLRMEIGEIQCRISSDDLKMLNEYAERL